MNASSRNPSFLSRRRLLTAGAAAAALVATGCGGDDAVGGVGTGGTGSFSSGPIRGFGSIVVGGIHYDEAGATIAGDAGGALNPSALRLGMVVEVRGSDVRTAADGKRRSEASSIAVRSEIEGPVASVDLELGTFTVLGQVVQVTPTTVFDDDLRGGLAALQPGQIVEVYGLLQADGHYTATRVDDEDRASRYKLRGRVSAHNPGAKTFRIGTTVISYAGLAVDGLADGRYARVELATTPLANGSWKALRLQLYGTGIRAPGGRGVKAEIEGYITSFSDSRHFVVGGIAVDASDVGRLPAGLGLGVRVEVEGVLNDGVLYAHEVEIEDDDDDDEFEIEGRITSLDIANHRFTVRSIVVDYSSARFEDGTEADLAAGVKVEVEGRISADGTVLIASEVEFDD